MMLYLGQVRGGGGLRRRDDLARRGGRTGLRKRIDDGERGAGRAPSGSARVTEPDDAPGCIRRSVGGPAFERGRVAADHRSVRRMLSMPDRPPRGASSRRAARGARPGRGRRRPAASASRSALPGGRLPAVLRRASGGRVPAARGRLRAPRTLPSPAVLLRAAAFLARLRPSRLVTRFRRRGSHDPRRRACAGSRGRWRGPPGRARV